MLLFDMSDPLPAFETIKPINNGEEMLLLVMKQSPNRDEKAVAERVPSETDAMDNLHDVTFFPFEGPEDALRSLLTRWNLLHLFDALKNENMTVDVLKILNAGELKELTQSWKMGDRVLFNYHFEKWREEINLPISVRKTHSPLPEPLGSVMPTENPDFLTIHMPSSLNNLTPHSTGSRSPSNRSLHSVDISPETAEKHKVTVAEILSSHRNGQRVMEAYKKNRRLNEEQRNLLITMIGSYFEQRSFHMSLQTSYRLEKEILGMFPTEKLEFYRTERRGRIYTKYQNIKKSSRVFSDDEEGGALGPKSPKIQKVVPEQDASAWVHTLKYANLTSVEFDITWQACSNYRINQIFNECQNISDILTKWPQYLRPEGYKLIDKDFNELFKNYDSISNWNCKVQKLCKFLKKLKNVRDVSNKRILESILDKQSTEDPDVFALKTLWCLHSYLHPTSRFVRRDANGNKNIQRFTVKDSQESFLYVDLTIQGLEKHIESLLQRGESIQPFILAVGDSTFSTIEQCFVYLDGNLIAFESFLKALDVCFKSFHLFNLKYPKASDPFWTFVEAYFYDIDTGSKKSYKINTLLQELRD
ncbi:uncharacterized protein LOC109613118 [Musca domestica]|uniref:Uncharacterized protein LOC109613118 n=1 Tax=Musca domestica TaxID=7370 RepID=A0A9J7DJ94_MUSDO|nr:uncharacterized protein LOC109613118 [Musca domestica]